MKKIWMMLALSLTLIVSSNVHPTEMTKASYSKQLNHPKIKAMDPDPGW